MSWETTHQYYQALREVEDELDRRGPIRDVGDLPWQPAYAQIFGDHAGLLVALRRRWELLVEAQVEQPYDAAGRPTAELLALAARHRGLLAAVDRRGKLSFPTRHAPSLKFRRRTKARPRAAPLARF